MLSSRRTLFAVPASPQIKSAPVCVLGIDPAAAGATGYGVIERDGRRCRVLRFGALSAAPLRREGGDWALRQLRAVHDLVAALIAEFTPDGLAVESPFAAVNIKTALRLAEVRGVILLAAA